MGFKKSGSQGGPSGGGTNLGPIENTFGIGATASATAGYTVNRAAAESLRDTYASANAAWLALYNGNKAFYVRLVWAGNNVIFQRRDAAGTGWEDITQVVQGTKGTTGPPGPTQTAAQIGALLDGLIGNAFWRSRLSGQDLVDAIDLAVTSDVWRTSHTARRTALQVVALLDAYFNGTTWRTPGTGTMTGTGFTAADATDAAGALLATVDFFSYDSSTNVLTLAVPNEYVLPAMLKADTPTEKTAFRTRIGAEASGAVRPDGTVAFTSPVPGVDPTAAAHLVTKKYADANYGGSTPVQTHDLWVGWSADNAVTEAEVLAGASSDSATATLPTGAGNQFLWVWRSNLDGGDPSEVHIAGSLNLRNTLGPAVALTVSGVAGQLIVSVITQNVGLLGGENLRVV